MKLFKYEKLYICSRLKNIKKNNLYVATVPRLTYSCLSKALKLLVIGSSFVHQFQKKPFQKLIFSEIKEVLFLSRKVCYWLIDESVSLMYFSFFIFLADLPLRNMKEIQPLDSKVRKLIVIFNFVYLYLQILWHKITRVF